MRLKYYQYNEVSGHSKLSTYSYITILHKIDNAQWDHAANLHRPPGTILTGPLMYSLLPVGFRVETFPGSTYVYLHTW